MLQVQEYLVGSALLELIRRMLNGGGDTLTGSEHMSAYRQVKAILEAGPIKPVGWRFTWDYEADNGWCRNQVKYVESLEHVEHEDKSTWRNLMPVYAGEVVEVPRPKLCAAVSCPGGRKHGSLFCRLHQAAKSRTTPGMTPSNEALAEMMRADGFQQ